MIRNLNILLAGRSGDAIAKLRKHLSSVDRLEVTVRHIVNGHPDPLYDVAELPDLLVLHIHGVDGGELAAMLERPVSQRPPMVVVSGTDDPSAMRQAMKAGARDFLQHSQVTELVQSISQVRKEMMQQNAPSGELVAFINAKGGAGATFLACNLAHLTRKATDEPTALLGLDMQFPTLPMYFDIRLKHGLMRALESVEKLDVTALEAIMASHSSGLKLLAAKPEDFRFSFDNFVDDTNALLDLLLLNYRHVVVDVPRHLDEYNSQVISRASRIVLVVQQSLPHVQDATRLQQLLRDQLGIPFDHVHVVVNRYNKRAEIQLEDIEKALPGSKLSVVPNHYKDVSQSIDLGVPMYDHARKSAVTKALIKLQPQLFTPPASAQAANSAGGMSSLFQRSSRNPFFGGN